MKTQNLATTNQMAQIAAKLADGTLCRSRAQAILDEEVEYPGDQLIWVEVSGNLLSRALQRRDHEALVGVYWDIALAYDDEIPAPPFLEILQKLVKSADSPWLLAAIACQDGWGLDLRKAAVSQIKDQAVLVRLLAFFVIGPNQHVAHVVNRAVLGPFPPDGDAEELIPLILARLTHETLLGEWGLKRRPSVKRLRERIVNWEYLVKLALAPLLEPEDTGLGGSTNTWSGDYYLTSVWDEISRCYSSRSGEVEARVVKALREDPSSINFERGIQVVHDVAVLQELSAASAEGSDLKVVLDERLTDLRRKSRVPR